MVHIQNDIITIEWSPQEKDERFDAVMQPEISWKIPPQAAPHRDLGSQPRRRDDIETKSKKHNPHKIISTIKPYTKS